MSTFTVTNSKASGAGSLARAIDDAAASHGFDTITFAKGLSGSTINLKQTLVLAQSVFIDGDLNNDGKADIKLSGDSDKDGDGDIPILTIAAGNTVVLDGLGFVKGYDNGANYNAGSAIYNAGQLSISNSDFANNVAHGRDGAGGHAATVLSVGSLNIGHSHFTDNTAVGGSGPNGEDGRDYARYGAYSGGGGYSGGMAATVVMQLRAGTLLFDDVSSTGGRATGGAGGDGGDGGSGNSSLTSGNGGHGGSGGSASVVATAANIGGKLIIVGSAPILTGGQGGEGGAPGANYGGGLGSSGDIGDDGAGSVQTSLSGSLGSAATVLLVTNTKDSGKGSLRYAIDHALEGQAIEFADQLAGKTIHLKTQLTLSRDTEIRGDINHDGKADITISGDSDKNGAGDVRIFSIAANTTSHLYSLTLEDGFADQGGAIYAAANSGLYLNDTTLRDNHASKGGALFAGGGLTVQRSTFHDNSANYGGAVYVRGSNDVVFYNATMTGNQAAVGGAIDSGSNAVIRLNSSTIVGNDATQYAGGIDAFGGSEVIVFNSIISGNTSLDFPDMGGTTTHDIQVYFSIIGKQATADSGDDIVRTNDPKLGELLDNGGTVLTLAPLDGSLVATATDIIGAQAYQRDQLIIGTDGANKIIGGLGDDTLQGGLGKDTLDGGQGKEDTADYSDKSKSVSVTLKGAKSADVRIDGVKEDKVKGIEHIIGGSGDDQLRGDGSNNLLVGNNGKDLLVGGGGKDTLIGGTAQDTLTGGGADDTFRFIGFKESPTGAKADVITDFDAAGMGDDSIDLSFLTGIDGPKLKYLASDAFDDVNQVRVRANGADVIVEVNLVGNDHADFAIRLLDTKLIDMGKGDFLL